MYKIHIVALFIKANSVNSNYINRRVCVCTHTCVYSHNIQQFKKVQNTDTCNKIDESHKYSKWKDPDTNTYCLTPFVSSAKLGKTLVLF